MQNFKSQIRRGLTASPGDAGISADHPGTGFRRWGEATDEPPRVEIAPEFSSRVRSPHPRLPHSPGRCVFAAGCGTASARACAFGCELPPALRGRACRRAASTTITCHYRAATAASNRKRLSMSQVWFALPALSNAGGTPASPYQSPATGRASRSGPSQAGRRKWGDWTTANEPNRLGSLIAATVGA